MIAYSFAFLVTAILLFAPGLCLLRLLRADAFSTAALAPLPSLAWYGVAPIAYDALGVSCSWLTLFPPCLALCVVIGVIARVILKGRPLCLCPFNLSLPAGKHGENQASPRFKLLVIALFLFVAGALYVYLFCRNAGSASMFLQNYDNVTHLTQIRLFEETGIYSSLHKTSYDLTAEALSRPIDGQGSFYPSAWHAVGAMTLGLTGAPVTTIANAVNGVFVVLVFPLGVLALLCVVLPSKPYAVLLGCLGAVVFEAFPWGFLTFGPLYPNLAAYCLLPAVSAAFVVGLRPGIRKGARVLAWVFVALGCVNFVFLQPNAVFAAVALLTPYVISVMLLARPSKGPLREERGRIACAVAFGLFVIAFWVVCHNLPLFADIVKFGWAPIASKRQALVDVFTLSLADAPAQLWLGLLVILGAIVAWRNRATRWLVFSYVIAAVLYWACASMEGSFKQLLSGFWYNDAFRLAAILGIAGIPLATLGLWGTARLCVSLLNDSFLSGFTRRSARLGKACVAIALLSAVLVFYPSYGIGGRGDVTTAFGFFEAKVQRLANYAEGKGAMLTDEEQAFLEKVAETVPEGALILNQPYDGSVFAYGLDGLNIYYRYVIDYGYDDELPQSFAIREGLASLTEDEEVAQSVADTGASYLLLLDQGNRRMTKEAFDVYLPEQWEGINAITDDTPGFETVLAEGDMRLYRIEQPNEAEAS